MIMAESGRWRQTERKVKEIYIFFCPFAAVRFRRRVHRRECLHGVNFNLEINWFLMRSLRLEIYERTLFWIRLERHKSEVETIIFSDSLFMPFGSVLSLLSFLPSAVSLFRCSWVLCTHSLCRTIKTARSRTSASQTEVQISSLMHIAWKRIHADALGIKMILKIKLS